MFVYRFPFKTVTYLLVLLASKSTWSQSDSLKPKAHIVIAKPEIWVEAGLLCSFLKQEKINKSPTYNGCAGFSFRRRIDSHSFFQFRIDYQHKHYERMQTELYDFGYQVNVNLCTSFSFDEIEVPLFYGFYSNKYTLAIGIAPSYLIASNINQTPSGDFGMSSNNIRGKYTLINYSSLAPFHSVNISPGIELSYSPLERIKLIYQFTYELMRNPLTDYSYFGPFNFLSNKILISFKLH
jgi:hypothetical protein